MGFGFYSPVTYDHLQVPSNQTDFPVCVAVTDARFATVANGGKVQNANGYDLIPHSDSALTTRLSFERAYYNAVTGQIEFHVKEPTLSSTVDDVHYFGYGDAAIVTDQADPTNVWDANFKGVYHFPDGTTLGLNDSTSNANNLTNHSATAGSGRLDGGIALARASAQYADKGAALTANQDEWTLSVWGNPVSVGLSAPQVAIYNGDAGPNGYGIAVSQGGGGGSWVAVLYGGLSWQSNIDTQWTAGSMQHVAARRTGGVLTIFRNAVASGTTYSATPAAPASSFMIGDANQAGTHNYWDGTLDEGRCSSVARSNDWITIDYNNQKSGSTFLTLGTEVTVSSGAAGRSSGWLLPLRFIGGP